MSVEINVQFSFLSTKRSEESVVFSGKKRKRPGRKTVMINKWFKERKVEKKSKMLRDLT